jgi:hypothetical protein
MWDVKYSLTRALLDYDLRAQVASPDRPNTHRWGTKYFPDFSQEYPNKMRSTQIQQSLIT